MKENRLLGQRLGLVAAFLVFGTVGLFRRGINLPSGLIAMARGAIGAAFLLAVILFRKQKPDPHAIRRNLLPLLLTGALIGFNWILLFEAYNHTTVATATLCYYLSPTLQILAAAVLFKEKLTPRRIVCAIAAVIGMLLVSGIWQTGAIGSQNTRGVLLGLGAAVLYASVIMLNKWIRGVSAYDKTLVQLAAAAAVMLPYTALSGELKGLTWDTRSVLLLILMGVLHTGVTYAVYFAAVERLPSRTCAMFSYIDPVTALLLSALVLREPLGAAGIAGAALILGAAAISEIRTKNNA